MCTILASPTEEESVEMLLQGAIPHEIQVASYSCTKIRRRISEQGEGGILTPVTGLFVVRFWAFLLRFDETSSGTMLAHLGLGVGVTASEIRDIHAACAKSESKDIELPSIVAESGPFSCLARKLHGPMQLCSMG